MTDRCECGKEYVTTPDDMGLCPTCKAAEDLMYANDPTPYVETDTRQFTRAAIYERHGITRDEDI